MKFPYRKINLKHPFSSKDFILRPIIPVSIQYNNRNVRYEALIDSGADFNIFPLEIANKLGIKFKKASTIDFAGIGGNMIQGFISDVLIELGNTAFATKAVFAEVGNGVLGEYGLFDLCKLKFDLKSKIIEIETR